MTRRRWIALALGILAWVAALVFVRVSLDWSDSQPYEGAVTENRYILFIAIAAAIAGGGTVAAIILWIRERRRPRS